MESPLYRWNSSRTYRCSSSLQARKVQTSIELEAQAQFFREILTILWFQHLQLKHKLIEARQPGCQALFINKWRWCIVIIKLLVKEQPVRRLKSECILEGPSKPTSRPISPIVSKNAKESNLLRRSWSTRTSKFTLMVYLLAPHLASRWARSVNLRQSSPCLGWTV